jgi:hypothetical protein
MDEELNQLQRKLRNLLWVVSGELSRLELRRVLLRARASMAPRPLHPLLTLQKRPPRN